MLAMTPVQCGQGHQRNAKKREKRRKKNAISTLARPSKAKLLWADARYSDEATGNDDKRKNNASLATCHNCIMTDWRPVHVAGGNVGIPRAATPAGQGQRHPRDKGNNVGAMLATTMAQCWHARH
jgi:hypothetical protein